MEIIPRIQLWILNFSITTKYSLWLTFLCIGLAALYSYILYREDTKFEELTIWKVRTMMALRFATVFFLAFLLLSPMLKTLSRYIEKPILVIAQDNSESVAINKDSAFYRNEYPRLYNDFKKKLSGDYEINEYSFGEKLVKGISFSYNDKETNYSDLFEEIENKYSNRNVGALILASDGIYNKGNNPLYSASDIGFPVYSIALGDTNRQKDVILSQIKANKIAFLGNIFPIQAVVTANGFTNQKTKLRIIHNNKDILSNEININSESFFETVNFELEAKKTGLQHYQILVTPINDEISMKNNRKDIIVDVIDSKQKILIIGDSPHPDIGAIHRTLELNRNYEIESTTIERFTNLKSLREYNLVILHQLPSKTNSVTSLLSELSKNDVPVLFIVGVQSDLRNINNLRTGFRITYNKPSFDNTQAWFNEKFDLFRLNREINDFLTKVPPLTSPFGNYKVSPTANILFYREIKNVRTKQPLVLFDNQGEKKVCFIIGEGIWRWRLYDYLINGSHDIYNQLLNKIVQYLALKVNKEHFVVIMNNVYNENEAVVVNAEVYNESYELISDAEVEINIYNDDNKEFHYVLNPEQTGTKTYSVNAGALPLGDYHYEAKAKAGKKEYTKNGKFSVISVNIESEKIVADHQVLFQLAQKNNGKLYYPAQFDQLAADLAANEKIVPVSYSEKRLQDIVRLKWIFALLVVLLSVEWFLRKYFGGY